MTDRTAIVSITPTLRLATEADAADVQAIYAPIVRDIAISFEVEPPTVNEMRQRIAETLAHLPWPSRDQDWNRRWSPMNADGLRLRFPVPGFPFPVFSLSFCFLQALEPSTP